MHGPSPRLTPPFGPPPPSLPHPPPPSPKVGALRRHTPSSAQAKEGQAETHLSSFHGGASHRRLAPTPRLPSPLPPPPPSPKAGALFRHTPSSAQAEEDHDEAHPHRHHTRSPPPSAQRWISGGPAYSRGADERWARGFTGGLHAKKVRSIRLQRRPKRIMIRLMPTAMAAPHTTVCARPPHPPPPPKPPP